MNDLIINDLVLKGFGPDGIWSCRDLKGFDHEEVLS